MSYPYEFLEQPAVVPDAEPAPSPLPEHRITTHDGYLWPVARADMVQVRAIRARMAEDAGELIRAQGEFGCVTQADFRRLGWTAEQVREHARAAIALATEAQEAA